MTETNCSYNLSIHWIRHGESCSNFLTGKIKDKPSQNIKERSLFEKLKGSILNEALLEPPLSLTGILQSLKLANRLEKLFDKGLKANQHIFITSPSSRSIMTALLALHKFPNVTLFVVPYISEKRTIGSFVGLDVSNKPVEPTILRMKVDLIIKWLNNNGIFKLIQQIVNDVIREQNISYKTVDSLNIMTSLNDIRIISLIKNKLGEENYNLINEYYKLKNVNTNIIPNIDFTYYTKTYNKPNLNKFYEVMYSISEKKFKCNNINLYRIIAFSHSHFIQDIYKQLFPNNKSIKTIKNTERLITKLNLKKENLQINHTWYNIQREKEYETSIDLDLLIRNKLSNEPIKLNYLNKGDEQICDINKGLAAIVNKPNNYEAIKQISNYDDIQSLLLTN